MQAHQPHLALEAFRDLMASPLSPQRGHLGWRHQRTLKAEQEGHALCPASLPAVEGAGEYRAAGWQPFSACCWYKPFLHAPCKESFPVQGF